MARQRSLVSCAAISEEKAEIELIGSIIPSYVRHRHEEVWEKFQRDVILCFWR